MGKITETTLIPIGLVLIIASGVFWIAIAKAKVDAVADNDVKQDQRFDQFIEKQDYKDKKMFEILYDMRERMVRIEAKHK